MLITIVFSALIDYIVTSAEMNNERGKEVLSSGAVSSAKKPISHNDLDAVWDNTLSHTRNGT